METTHSSAALNGVPPAVIERSRRLLAEIDARPKDAPISELGKSLAAIRQRYLDNGGTLLSNEETDKLVQLYRFGIGE